MRLRVLPIVLLASACASSEEPPPADAPASVAPEAAATPEPAPPPRELPFEPSEGDKASFGTTGFVGVAKVPPETGFAKGPKIYGVKPGSGLEAVGVKAGDVLVKFAGVTFAADDDDAIGTYRKRLLELPFDSDAQATVWNETDGVREVTVRLGRQPPPFADRDTPADWLAPVDHDDDVAKLIADAVALDHGEARYADVLARNRKHLSKTDSFRLKEVTQAHLDLAANERMARRITSWVNEDATKSTLVIAEVVQARECPRVDVKDLTACVELLESQLVAIDRAARDATSAWHDDDRKFAANAFVQLTSRINEGEYLYDDPVVSRERSNRRLVHLLALVNRDKIYEAATLADSVVWGFREVIASLAAADGREGLLIAKDTPAGRIEIWGRGNTRHTERTAFCFDLGGNDDWLDCAGRADLDHPVSITIDWDGNDTYGGTSPFNEGGALGGVGILWDHAGDDQYLARTWSQGCGVAGFGLLQDDSGRDVYHGQDECQGVGMAGAGALVDGDAPPDRRAGTPPALIRRAGDGADLYTGVRFCQGIGFPGGVGALIDKGGDDRYVCTGRYDSEYGEPGLFSGFGQGVGFGFRNVASGGIGVLYDIAGDDVYEAGNFSQGGGYSYAWGILRDDAGDDRYIGSRYAQGFAAHQAVGTFLEGGGNDLYQSHSTVACGLSWDETSVVFHDVAGDDVYEQGGFSLASAAQNGMVLFLDDAGNDRYAALPAHAANNEYHGGKSFALFVDRGGDDTYGSEKAADWNDRVFWCDEGAYLLDLPPSPKPLKEYVR